MSVGARLAGRLLSLCVPRLRRVAVENLTLAGYTDADRIADQVFDAIGRIIVTFLRFPRLTPTNIHELIEYDGLINFTNAMKKGKGVLVATAHLGNWELSAFSHAWMTGPMNIVVRPLDSPRIDRFVAHRRTLSGNTIIEKKDGARGIFRALAKKEAVGILIDQNTSVDEGVFIDFFGRKACAGSAFVRFAHKTGAPVVPGYALWNESRGKYILHFDPEIPMSGDVQADTQRIHSHLESVIRAYPGQWLWVHRRWKTQPSR